MYEAMMLSALVLFKGAASQSCAAVYSAGVPAFPLDACLANVAGDVGSSYKYYCSGSDAKYAVYLSGDCTGDATEVDATGYDVVCDGMPSLGFSHTHLRTFALSACDCVHSRPL